MLPSTEKELKLYQDSIVCYFCRKEFTQKLAKDKNHRKVRYCCYFIGKYRVAAHNICNLTFNVPNKISVVFHNGENYNYHFIMVLLANEFKDQFECLGGKY